MNRLTSLSPAGRPDSAESAPAARRAIGSRSPDRRSPSGEAGFAILMVVTMLAFIVLLLVGLAAYTQVETAISGNTQRQAQARENALLGLNVALGQLQRYAGPDTRVTAPAEAFQYRTGTRRYTGVWPADGQEDDDGDPLTPLTWLVSGNEARDSDGNAMPRAVTPETALNANTGAQLVGANTSRTNNDVLARLVPITAPSVPGMPVNSNTPIGRYAWWVGDQGIKAPVALNDRAVSPESSAQIAYPPYDTKELLRRIRQQIALGPGPATSAGAAVFEPRNHSSGSTPRNADLVVNVVAPNQIAFLKNSAGNALGLTTAQSNFHTWSTDNLAVLANSRAGGLRRDLSLRPDLLGSAFAAWADYPTYMEDPRASETPPVNPPNPEIVSPEALRRRYRITPPLVEGPIAHGVAPVLSFCLLNFDSRTEGGTDDVAPVEMRLRWVVGLWNPYSSALVPEDLRIEIFGLPEQLEFVPSAEPEPGAEPVPLAAISPAALFGTPLKLALPWDRTRSSLVDSEGVSIPSASSWLPGRVYYWTSVANTAEPDGGNPGTFYSRDPAVAGAVTRVSSSTLKGDTLGGWRVSVPTQLIVRVFRKDDTEPLATYTSPAFEPFLATDPVAEPAAMHGAYEFSFLFRLNESAASGWLTTPGRDPREAILSDAFFVSGANGPLPELYPGTQPVRNDDLLLDRQMGSEGRSYNQDVPVFELPRSPVLSLGSLQHLRVPTARPFVIGNSWGSSVELVGGAPANRIFDQYFLSGLTAPVLAGATELLDQPVTLPLPNPLLKVQRRKVDGSATRLRDVIGAAEGSSDPSPAYSSKHLLQRGAFNFNSTNAVAWLAVLRGTRYSNSDTFRYLNVSRSSGTNADTSVSSTTPADSVFFRFPQSAQETFKASEPGSFDTGDAVVPSTYAASNTEPPTAPNELSNANTHLFRRGMRALSTAETVALANAIASRVLEKHRESGPFVSVEDFLAPRVLFADPEGRERSLLETAIAEAKWVDGTGTERTGLNYSIAEFSSQWLTQADVMTALAPYLFARSDTFIVRAYGEAINPGTGTIEGRAWCEALVQRMPEYVDKTQPEETTPAELNAVNTSLGRRFKVVSFRWLTRADI